MRLVYQDVVTCRHVLKRVLKEHPSFADRNPEWSWHPDRQSDRWGLKLEKMHIFLTFRCVLYAGHRLVWSVSVAPRRLSVDRGDTLISGAFDVSLRAGKSSVINLEQAGMIV